MVKKIQTLTLSTCNVHSRISATGAAKVDQMHKTLQVVPRRAFRYRRVENVSLFFSVALIKCSARLPELQCLAKNTCTTLQVKFFSFDTVIKYTPSLFDSPGIFMY
jgi:hypothetical protein